MPILNIILGYIRINNYINSRSWSEVSKIQIIFFLGELLSKEIGISEAASRGLIKLAIKEELGPYQELNTIDLRDYQKIIQNSLKNRLLKLNIENFKQIIDVLLKEILENQSLITMEKI